MESKPRRSGYVPQEIEPKWQQVWAERGVMKADDSSPKPKFYNLVMFPYPSGPLHMGHMRNYVIGDLLARFKRMQGFEVLNPMGWDAFGLPAENDAIKRGGGVHPEDWTRGNIAIAKRQLGLMGVLYDWDREVTTCDPSYYRWTQDLFLLFFERGLAHRMMSPVNWCPVDKTVLANEQVINGRCWRHPDVEVEKRDLEQWFLRITEYADRLLDDLALLDHHWPEKVLTMQANWIGRSHGVEVEFPIDGHPGESMRIYTTRPDTLFGVTFMVLAPEHPLVEKLTVASQRRAVREVVAAARKEREIDRMSSEVKRLGAPTGAFAINPLNGEKVPVWVADYVLITYGTGAIMASARPRPEGLRFRAPVRSSHPTGDRAAWRAAGRDGKRLHRTWCDGQQWAVRWAGHQDRLRPRRRIRRPEGDRQALGQVPPARLVDLTPAVLGLPDSCGALRGRWNRPCAALRAPGVASTRVQTARRDSRFLAH